MSEEMVTITKKEYDRLIKADDWVDALEAAGVDNWDGINLAIDIFNDGLGR